MISLGKNIRQPNDTLEKITLKQLSDKIKNPDRVFIDFITQLRQVQGLNPTKYRELKTRLPYVVAAVFNPPYRKIENFARTGYFILDIDHLSEKEMDIKRLEMKMKDDPRIALMFRSPSDDGLKLFFRLNEPFYDHGKYSLFYKVFARQFANDYSIDQVIDKRTSDVSRACFVSYDPGLWYNPDPEPVDPGKYINFDDQLQTDEMERMLKKEEKEIKEKGEVSTVIRNDDVSPANLPSEIIREIREKLNPKLATKREKQIYVPEELNEIIERINSELARYNIEVDEIVNINYGKQFRMKLGNQRAEINVFYGKRGFSVVKSTKSGLSRDLVDAAHDIITVTIL